MLAGTFGVLFGLLGWLPLLERAANGGRAKPGWESKTPAAAQVALQQEEARKAPKPWQPFDAIAPAGFTAVPGVAAVASAVVDRPAVLARRAWMPAEARGPPARG